MRKLLTFLAVLAAMIITVFAVPSPREIYTQSKYYEALYRDFPVGISFMDKDGRFLHANAIMCNFLGRSEDELKRINKYDITARQDVEAELLASQKIISGEDKTYTIFKQYVHKRGDSLWARLTVIGIREDTGAFSHFISIVEPLSNSTFFEADINKKLEDIKTGIERIKTTEASSFLNLVANNWQTLIPWTFAGILTIGGILFRIQMDSKRIKDLEEKLKELGEK